MKCERHLWDTEDKEWCWKCEEAKIEENKKTYENKFRDHSVQRIDGNKKTSPLFIGKQEDRG